MIKQYVINYKINDEWNHMIVETNSYKYLEQMIPEDWTEYEIHQLQDTDRVDIRPN